MSKFTLLNASPDEIRQYFKGASVQWVRTFQQNHVPDDIIFEFKDRIFSGDYLSRSQEIVYMHVRRKIKMSDDLFKLLTSHTAIEHLYHINEVYDIVSYIKTLSHEQLHYMGSLAIHAIENHSEVDGEMLDILLNLSLNPTSKIDAIAMIIKRNKFTSEAKERAVQYAKENWPDSNIKAGCYVAETNVKLFLTAFEYIKKAPKEKLIGFFDNYRGYKYNEDDFKEPEILDYIVETIIAAHNEGLIPELRQQDWKKLRSVIKDHERFSEVEEILVSEQERYMSTELDWKDVDVRISNNELSHEVVESVLLRQDAPLWFTDKYQSKLLQILARNSANTDKQHLLVDRQGNYITHPFYTFMNNHSKDGFF